MKKEVLQLIETSGPGGAEKMLINLVRQLSKGQYRPIVCLRKEGWLSTQLKKCGCQTYIISHKGYLNGGWFLQLRNLIRGKNVSIIHAHEFTMNTYGTILSVITGIPIITTVHGKN